MRRCNSLQRDLLYLVSSTNQNPSNTVQIVSSIFLLKGRQLDVLRTNLVGGILSSVLLVLGIGIFLGGISRIEQFFNLTVAHISANMLSLAATSLLIPTASRLLLQTSGEHLIRQSRGASFVLMVVYGALFIFQFGSHQSIYTSQVQKVPTAKQIRDETAKEIAKGLEQEMLTNASETAAPAKVLKNELSPAEDSLGQRRHHEDKFEDEVKPEPQLSHVVMAAYLIAMVTLTAFCTQFAVDSIDKLSQQANISKPFIGLILLPILNNDTTPIHHALRDEMHKTIYFTVGKCLQTALFVTPLMVLVAWGMHLDLTLSFDGFEVVSLFASVLLLNYLIIDGKSSW